MTYSELIWDGLDLMIVGMGTVFVFLTMLVGAVALMSKLATMIEPRPSATASPRPQPSGTPPPEHVAAITAAIHRYRARHR